MSASGEDWAAEVELRIAELTPESQRKVRLLIRAVAFSDDDGAAALALSRRNLAGELDHEGFVAALVELLGGDR